jgi:dynein heavy chain
VAPKEAKYKEVSAVLKKAESELKVKTDEVAEVKAKVAELESSMQKMLDEKEAMEFEMDRSSKRMTRANKLVGLLADEGERWKNTVEHIQEEIDKLVGDVFISCACISYYGAFTGPYRKRLVDMWLSSCLEREIPTSDNYSLVTTMGDPVIIRSWGIASLPSDPTSTENGILTTKAERYPLCIDP